MAASNIKLRLDKTLGRQMFQIAAGYAYALDHDVELYVDFDVAYYLRPILEACPIIKHKSQELELFKTLKNGDNIKEGSELFIQGSFQDLKYFDHRKEEIKQLFSSLVSTNQENTLGIHIRAGELMSNVTKVPHVDLSYIHVLLDSLNPEEVDSIVVYSDDNCLAKRYIYQALQDNEKWKEKNYYVCTDFNTLNVFKAMTSSRILAIANSSLSWWAAYLGTYKKVLTPDLYIIGEPYTLLNCAEWEQIEIKNKKSKIAVLVNLCGSNTYTFKEFYDSCIFDLFPSTEKHFFVFTEANNMEHLKTMSNVTVVPYRLTSDFINNSEYGNIYKNYTHVLVCNKPMLPS